MSKDTELAVCVQELLHFETELRLFHWTTASYARHKASDALYTQLRDWIDRFLETAFGRNVRELARLPRKWDMPIRRWTEQDAAPRVRGFADHIAQHWHWSDPGLASLRDDLLNELHQTVFLLRLE